MRSGPPAGLALVAIALAGAASAQQAAPAFASSNLTPAGVRALAATCNPCHGPAGRPVPGSTVAGLAGRPAAQIATMMAEFREGRRAATLMPQIARGFSDAEIAAVADYFSKQTR